MDYLRYFDLLDALDREEPTRKKKTYKRRYDPFSLEDEEFINIYKFSKKYAEEVVALVRSDIEQTRRGGSFSAELQVCAALRTWTREGIQDDAANLHGMSQQSISNVCRRVAIALASRAAEFIHMPLTLEEEADVTAGFRKICGFRNVIGAVDCTYTKVKKVGGDNSINVQIVCDSKSQIRDIEVHWQGRTNNVSQIFKESRIGQQFENKEFYGHLLGDASYGLTSFLFTPIKNPSNSKEEEYNSAHLLTRYPVERCICVWKQRFPCLLHGFSVSLENAKLYIVALAVLHNIAIRMGENFESLEQSMSQNNRNDKYSQDQRDSQDSIDGLAARQLFITTSFRFK